MLFCHLPSSIPHSFHSKCQGNLWALCFPLLVEFTPLFWILTILSCTSFSLSLKNSSPLCRGVRIGLSQGPQRNHFRQERHLFGSPVNDKHIKLWRKVSPTFTSSRRFEIIVCLRTLCRVALVAIQRFLTLQVFSHFLKSQTFWPFYVDICQPLSKFTIQFKIKLTYCSKRFEVLCEKSKCAKEQSCWNNINI